MQVAADSMSQRLFFPMAWCFEPKPQRSWHSGVEKRRLCFVHTQLPKAVTGTENQFEYEIKSCPEEVKSSDCIRGQKEVEGSG